MIASIKPFRLFKKVTKRTWLIAGVVTVIVCLVAAVAIASALQKSSLKEAATATKVQSHSSSPSATKESAKTPAPEEEHPVEAPQISGNPSGNVTPKTIPSTNTKPHASSEHPFTVSILQGIARTYCLGVGNPVMSMIGVSFFTPYPAVQPTPVNWQIEFMHENAISIVQAGVFTAQPGALAHDVPGTDGYRTSFLSSTDKMRFHITSPNDIASSWSNAGDGTCQ